MSLFSNFTNFYKEMLLSISSWARLVYSIILLEFRMEIYLQAKIPGRSHLDRQDTLRSLPSWCLCTCLIDSGCSLALICFPTQEAMLFLLFELAHVQRSFYAVIHQCSHLRQVDKADFRNQIRTVFQRLYIWFSSYFILVEILPWHSCVVMPAFRKQNAASTERWPVKCPFCSEIGIKQVTSEF